ncbi:hypothetical protein PM082_006239 [Marasmius tenuissimus]|nr:hypothetical protein PM082_006239 [Marasmius tenuissimus]
MKLIYASGREKDQYSSWYSKTWYLGVFKVREDTYAIAVAIRVLQTSVFTTPLSQPKANNFPLLWVCQKCVKGSF